jgi:NTP pyrophosphatase (non-canonical NTP hydrolase)
MSDLDELKKIVLKFIEDRDWSQFHNPKDLAISLNLEAAEVLEHFQWKTEDEIKKYIKTNKRDISDELADVLYWIILIANNLNIDLMKAFKSKMKENTKKYPVEKSKGSHSKYTEYQ